MTNEPTPRQKWVEACVDRYLKVAAIDPESAIYYAEACAESQAETNGPNVTEWDDAAEMADEDMAYWEEE